MIPIPGRINIDEAVQNSYRNFHAKGVDYVCVYRSPALTLKLYFFDGDVSKLPEVVNPHDHRYPFDTWVVSGRLQNKSYRSALHGTRHQLFRWETPLLGGNGFRWAGEVNVALVNTASFEAGQRYHQKHDSIHTIKMLENETVMFIAQYADAIPDSDPTATFCPGDSKEPPSIEGCYSRFTADQMIDRLRRFALRTGYDFGGL